MNANPEIKITSTLTDDQTDQLVELYSNEFWCNTRTRSDVEKMLAHTDIVIGLIDIESNLVGFVRALTDYTYKVMIYDLIVHPEWRGKRLGKVLMDELINHPKLKSIYHFDLYCMPEMRGFYAQWGFTSDLGNLGIMRKSR